MRDALTTATEVAGMISIAVAAALAFDLAWLGWFLSGVALVATGVLEARR